LIILDEADAMTNDAQNALRRSNSQLKNLTFYVQIGFDILKLKLWKSSQKTLGFV